MMGLIANAIVATGSTIIVWWRLIARLTNFYGGGCIGPLMAVLLTLFTNSLSSLAYKPFCFSYAKRS